MIGRVNKNNKACLNFRRQRGQLMVELIIAMGLMTIGLLGILAVLSQSLSLNRVAANQYIAAGLAAEGIEVTKNILDANTINDRPWNDGNLGIDGDYQVQFDDSALNPLTGAPLNFDEATGIYSYGAGTATNFRRRITVTNIDTTGDTFSDELKIVSLVTWKDKGGINFEVEVEDHFRNWR